MPSLTPEPRLSLVPPNFDPEILKDFITEADELLRALEADLVLLESTPSDDELLNRVFRALHTIKGSASFLALTNLVAIAHAAESAFNAARSRVFVVDRHAMDLLLRTVDIIKAQLDQVRIGASPNAPPVDIVDRLSHLATGSSPNPAPSSGAPPPSLVFPTGKAELVEFLVADVDATLASATKFIEAMNAGDRQAPGRLAETSESLAKALDFFELSSMAALARLMMEVGEAVSDLASEQTAQLTPRLHAILHLLKDQAEGLRVPELRERPIETLTRHVHAILAGEALPPEARLESGATYEHALEADGVREVGRALSIEPDAIRVTAAPAPADAAPSSPAPDACDAPLTAPRTPGTVIESTIRVEVDRLEALMNFVGELVLQKNRVNSLLRRSAVSVESKFSRTGGNGEGGGMDAHEQQEQLAAAAAGLDRVIAEIQSAVMRTRMQPLDKIFGRYPRLVRDLAARTGKQIRLVVIGAETELDRSIIEKLADPMMHILRNAADHGLETPAERVAAGKPAEGTITVRASQEGAHVRLTVTDDGRGLNRERIVKKAVERGLVTPTRAEAMTDAEVHRFVFEPGFSTAENVTELSGRGVGLDVVRNNIEQIKGTVELSSTPGHGATVSLLIPLTLAILPAMMVGIGVGPREEIFAFPIANIVEIVRPGPLQISTIGSRPVLRLRDGVIPLVLGASVFGIRAGSSENGSSPFVLVLSVGDDRLALSVSRLLGQQDIVVKPLDGVLDSQSRPISGATIREDGGVTLIADVLQLLRHAQTIKAGIAGSDD